MIWAKDQHHSGADGADGVSASFLFSFVDMTENST